MAGREQTLKVGKAYVALKSFEGFPTDFFAGRVYVLDHVGYSPYDECTMFKFRDLDNDTSSSWLWNDNKTDIAPEMLFKIKE